MKFLFSHSNFYCKRWLAMDIKVTGYKVASLVVPTMIRGRHEPISCKRKKN